MRVLLVNPPYQTITSNRGVGHQVPLGLLMVGGPLRDLGHDVELLDAEALALPIGKVVDAVQRAAPDVLMTGHAGSMPAHPVTMRMLRAVKAALPSVTTVYGGVYPTAQAATILAEERCVDFIVRGEGEETAGRLVDALAGRGPEVHDVPSLAFRAAGGRVAGTTLAPPIRSLDAWRVGWELIRDWDRYRCFGLGRAAIVQWSRGCPHRCTYCGQFGFWRSWRHRDPVRLVDEIERLHREHDVRFLTLADENPTTLPDVWRDFLAELAARRLPVKLFATIRAGDIVRDRDVLHLYRDAGILYVLMGIDATDPRLIESIRKRSSTSDDQRACRLLREHGIFSIIGHIVGFEDESWASFRAARRALVVYDGDHLNAMHATPHPGTAFASQVADRRVADTDLSHWDYRHQVLAQETLAPWQVFLAVKWLELRFHLRLRRLWRIVRSPAFERRQLLWCLLHTGMVFLAEVAAFVRGMFRPRPARTVREFHRMRESARETRSAQPVSLRAARS